MIMIKEHLILIHTIALLHSKTTYYKDVDIDEYKKIFEETMEKINYIYNYYLRFLTGILRRIFMRAVITVIGKDNVGILAKVSNVCAEYNANVMDVTQSVLQDMFAMIMMVDISQMNTDFVVLGEKLNELGKSLNLSIHTMHQDIFNSMHRI